MAAPGPVKKADTAERRPRPGQPASWKSKFPGRGDCPWIAEAWCVSDSAQLVHAGYARQPVPLVGAALAPSRYPVELMFPVFVGTGFQATAGQSGLVAPVESP